MQLLFTLRLSGYLFDFIYIYIYLNINLGSYMSDGNDKYETHSKY